MAAMKTTPRLGRFLWIYADLTPLYLPLTHQFAAIR